METAKTGTSVLRSSGAPSARSMMKSFGLHVLVALLLLLVPAQVLVHSEPPKETEKEVEIVFYRSPQIPIPRPSAPVSPLPKLAAGLPPGAPAPARNPRPDRPPGPDGPGKPELPPGPEEGPTVDVPPQPKAGTAGILAFKDKFASLAKDKIAPRLGADARHNAADEVGQPSSRSSLTSTSPGGSGGINSSSLTRNVGGGGGGAGGGGTGGGGIGGRGAGGTGGGGGGTRLTSAITGVSGNDRPKARAGDKAARTDEEIQIVFDRYKASFYRLYNRELRNNPTLQGQMVLRLTIEPDGSVSMCVLQSTDMDAADLAAQVVSRVKTINFGAKDVLTVTISYPIDFLPAG